MEKLAFVLTWLLWIIKDSIAQDQFTSSILTGEYDFKCVSRGRFADSSDPTCSRYYYCYQSDDGTFLKRTYYCRLHTYFDPDLQWCSENYKCSLVRPTEAAITRSFGVNNVTEEDHDSSVVVPTTTTVKPDVFKCSTRGRFADENDPNCEKYFLCSKLPDGTFITTPYKCPSSSYFDPYLKKCNANYVCSTKTTLMDELDNQTLAISSTEAITTTVQMEFTCSQVGRFPDYSDQNCRKYYLCSRLNNGTFIQTSYNCPMNSYFDPALRRCSNIYVCPLSSSTTVPTTTIIDSEGECTSVVPDSIGGETSCSKVGRFASKYDNSCKSYVLCNQLRNGTFIQTVYRCPLDSIFDAGKHLCSIVTNCHSCGHVSTII